MLLSEAMRKINPGQLRGIARAGDRVLFVNKRLAIKRICNKGLYDYRATFADLVADDWEIVDLEDKPEVEGDA